jgi:ATP-binding cassette subfamily C protein
MGDRLARRLNIPTLQAAISAGLAGRASAAAQAMRDVNELRLFVSGSSPTIPLDLLWTPVMLWVLFLLHPAFGVYAVASVAVLLLVSLLNDAATRPALAAASAENARSLQDLSAALRNTELLDGMGMLPAIAARWRRSHDATTVTLDAATRRGKIFASVAKICRLLMQAGVVALGVVLVLRGEASPGTMMGANLLIAKLLQPFDQLVSGWRQWSFAWAAWQRVRGLLEAAPETSRTLRHDCRSGRLVVEDLSFTPDSANRAVLTDVTFTVEPGESVCVVGPSGAGKSTLARLIVGLFQPSAGDMLLDGQPIAAWDPADLGRQIGYLPQSVALLDGTIFDNIARMDEADSEQVVEAARLAGIHELIGKLPQGYSTVVGSTGFGLSGGMRQRIGLARALFRTPKLLVLDEPNSNLDHDGEQALMRAIAEAKRAGTTVIVVTHRPAAIEIVDKVLVLKGGTVDSFGPGPRARSTSAARVAMPRERQAVRLVSA